MLLLASLLALVAAAAGVAGVLLFRGTDRQPRPLTDGGRPETDEAEGATSAAHKPSGVLRWVTTVDHRDIGLMYLVLGTIAGLWGGMDAMMLRTELLTPDPTVWDAETYNALFTAHGITMLFFFATPVFAGIANYFVPLLLDADDMAFPRINAIAFWLLPPSLVLARFGLITELIGKGIGLVVSALPGGADALAWTDPVARRLLALEPPGTGWTLYPPLSILIENQQVDLVLLALHLAGVATTLSAINFIVTVVLERGDGVNWANLDLFSWSILTQSALALFAFPVLGSTLIMLLLDRNVGTTFFLEPGGGPILFQHLFWFFGHPEVYILVLPAFGLISLILPKFSARRLFGYRFVVYSTLAIGVLSFGVWAHHMFATGMDPRLRASFMAVSIAIAIPSAVKTFNWIATMWNGRLRLTAPMLFCVGGIALFVFGGITGVFLASVPVDLPLHDTYYVVGHFHLIIMGIIPFSMFAASFYWFPLLTGRTYYQGLARAQAVVMTVGSFLTFMPQLVTGLDGLPRRYALYPETFLLGQQLSTVGAFVLGVGLMMWLFNVVQSARIGTPIEDADVWDLAETGQLSPEWARFAEERGESIPGTDDAYGDAPTDVDRPEGGFGDRSPVRLVAAVTAGVALLAAVGLFLLPAAGFQSTTDRLIRTLNRDYLLIAVPLAVLVEALLVYAVLRFRGNDDPLPTPENKRLEISWTVATALVLLFVAVTSYQVMGSQYVANVPDPETERPDGAVTVEVVAERFQYDVRYPAANVTVDDADVIYVPTDRPLYLETTSRDVIHSIHVPELSLKQDALPAESNVVHTRVTERGTYRLYCAEFCGTDHARMQAQIRALPPAEYRQRVDALGNESG